MFWITGCLDGWPARNYPVLFLVDTYPIHMSITCTLTGYFLSVFQLFVKPIEHIFYYFHIKQVLKDLLTSNFVIDTINK